MSAILTRLAPHYDGLVEEIYRAGSGLVPWLKPLSRFAEIFDAWTIQLLGVNKRTGIMSFSFEAGSAPPAAPVEYLRYWHRVDPRLQRTIPMVQGEWISCEEHFDEAFVEQDPFYSQYLIPFGGRFLYGTKLHDDANATVLIGHLTKAGNPPLSVEEKSSFRRLADHFGKALDIQAELADRAGMHSVGASLLEKMRQPMILLDHQRRISYRNRSAVELLARNELVYEDHGMLACRDAESDHALTLALRDLVLVPLSTHGDAENPAERRSFRLVRRDGRSVAATLLALRPESTMGGFGRDPHALFTVFEPGAPVQIDPFILSITFGLTPAEARLAAMIVNGSAPDECARSLHVKISTVRSQLNAIYGKTGATGQADLVRMILSAAAI